MRITVREWRKIIDFCDTPKNKKQIQNEFNLSASSVHKHLSLIPKEWLTLFKDKKDDDVNLTNYFVRARTITDEEIIAEYQKANTNYYQADISMKKPEAYLEKATREAEDIFREQKFFLKEIKDYEVKDSITYPEPHRMVVNGLNGYHTKIGKTARQRVHVGCSDNII